MAVKVALRIPPNFFDSADEDNNFESVSERIARAFLVDVLKLSGIEKGNPNLHEPDYVCNGHGYEVTFAIRKSLIPQLKGIKPLDSTIQNIEKELIRDISGAVKRKAVKRYSCIPSLVLITLSLLPTWYDPSLFCGADLFAKIARKKSISNRNVFFDELYTKYIRANIFENIYIILPTHSGSFAFFNIASYASGKDDFITNVQTNKPTAFPTYEVIGSSQDGDITKVEISVVNYHYEETEFE